MKKLKASMTLKALVVLMITMSFAFSIFGVCRIYSVSRNKSIKISNLNSNFDLMVLELYCGNNKLINKENEREGYKVIIDAEGSIKASEEGEYISIEVLKECYTVKLIVNGKQIRVSSIKRKL